MKAFLKILMVVLSLLAAASCIKDMDPFEGADGVRVNINGYKCVMRGSPGTNYVHYTGGESCSLRTEVEMTRMLDFHHFNMVFYVQDDNPLTVGKRYSTLSGNASVKLLSPKEAPGDEVSLSGWIQFVKFDSSSRIVEASFEFDGVASNGEDFVLRHGFFRLFKQSEDGQ